MLTALLMATCAASLSGNVAKDTPYHARLLAQADLPTATIDRNALAIERERLIESRPGLGFPITMLAIGGTTSVLFIAIMAASYYLETLIIGGVLLAGAATLVVIGIIALINRLGERKETDARIQAIDRKIGPAGPRTVVPDDLSAPPGPPPPMPQPENVPPPGPPPPPPPPLAMLTVATF